MVSNVYQAISFEKHRMNIGHQPDFEATNLAII